MTKSFQANHSGFYWLLTIAYVGFLLYGTLFPLSHWQSSDLGVWRQMWAHGLRGTSFSDIVTNLLVYVPLGLFLYKARARSHCAPCSIVLITVVSASLSLSLEILQAHLPGRVPAVSDLLLNTIGGLTGALLAAVMNTEGVLGARLSRLRSIYLKDGPLTSLGLIVLGFWMLSQLSPLVPSIDLGNLRNGIKPLAQSLNYPFDWNLLQLLEYLLAFIALGILASTLRKTRYRAVQHFALFTALVLLLKIPVVARQLSLEAVLGFSFSLVVLTLALRAPIQARLNLAVIALLLGIVATGAAPSSTDQMASIVSSFNWIPFRAHFSNNIIGLIDILGIMWPFMALGYIAIRLGYRDRPWLALLGALLLFGLSFALEWRQQSIPGRSPDITDPIMALIGWLVPWLYPAWVQPAERARFRRRAGGRYHR